MFAVITLCKRFKELVISLEAPIRGVASMLTAIRKLQSSSEQLTTLHADFLLLCILAKCYKTGISVLEDDIYETDQPRDYFLYCYYGSVVSALKLFQLWWFRALVPCLAKISLIDPFFKKEKIGICSVDIG